MTPKRNAAAGPDSDAFVVWIDRSGDRESLRGRVEHIGSSRRESFRGMQDLIDLLERALAEADVGTVDPAGSSSGGEPGTGA